MSLFTNGNARVTRLIIIQLGLAQLVIVINAIQGLLPAFGLSQRQLQITAATLSIICICIKCGEMFFNKVASLFKSGDTVIPPIDGQSQTLTATATIETKNETPKGV